MKAKVGIAIAPFALAAASSGTALAEEKLAQPEAQLAQVGTTQTETTQIEVTQVETTPSYMRAPMRAPRNAFEIGVNTGYTQGFGNISNGTSVGNVAGAGLGVGLDLGYRATPQFSIGLAGQYQEFNPDNELKSGTNVRGLTGTLQATVHFSPFERVDPFLTLGTGYRMLWEVPPGSNNNTLTHGFQLAKANVGLDFRVNDSIALGPMIGADLNMFVWTNPEGPRGNQQIDDVGLNTYIYAGLAGRFDIGGQREARIREIGSR